MDAGRGRYVGRDNIKIFIMKLIDNIKAETPKKYKKSRSIGLTIAGAGMLIKVVAALFPATMPLGIVALAPEIIGFGTLIAGYSQTKKVK